ncbi:Cell shape-determining protein MreC [Candidatus Hepatincolaceae symbiont of Richtersius coronifer]
MSRSIKQNVSLPILIILTLFAIMLLGFNGFDREKSDLTSYSIKRYASEVKYLFSSDIINYYLKIQNGSKVIARLTLENQKLKQQIALLNEQNLTLQIIKKEINELNNLLNIKSMPNITNIITVSLVNTNILSLNNLLNIKAGKNQNIQPNSLVVSSKGVVGYIKDVYRNEATILTLYDKNFKISAISQNANLNMILLGNGTRYPSLQVYAEHINLQENEPIFTSGLEGNFPKYLPIGTAFKDKNGNWKLKPIDDITQLQYVHIVK